MLNKGIKFLIENKLVAIILLVLFVGWGVVNAPFNWEIGLIPRDPVAVDAIPDIGENQQIVFTQYRVHYNSPKNSVSLKIEQLMCHLRNRVKPIALVPSSFH